MNKWEYKVISLHPTFKGWRIKTMELDSTIIEQTLNGLGNEGWELTSIASHIDDITLGTGKAKFIFVFKRQIK